MDRHGIRQLPPDVVGTDDEDAALVGRGLMATIALRCPCPDGCPRCDDASATDRD